MHKPTKKILLFGPMPSPMGGVSVHLSRLLYKSKDEADLELAVFDFRKVKLFRVEGQSGFWSMLLFFLKSSIVHIHYAHTAKVPIAIVSKLFGKKVFFTQHNMYGVDHPSTKRILAIADKVILVNPTMVPIPSKKMVVVPAFIPDTIGVSENVFFKRIASEYENVIMAISTHTRHHPSLIDGKDVYGFDLAIEAVKACELQKKTVLVLVDAAGVWKDKYLPSATIPLNENIDMLYLTEAIDFTSAIPYCTLFLRPTRTDGDALSVREALADGIKVVASDASLRPAGVFLFENDSVSSLTSVLTLALSTAIIESPEQPDFSKEVFWLYRNAD